MRWEIFRDFGFLTHLMFFKNRYLLSCESVLVLLFVFVIFLPYVQVKIRTRNNGANYQTHSRKNQTFFSEFTKGKYAKPIKNDPKEFSGRFKVEAAGIEPVLRNLQPTVCQGLRGIRKSPVSILGVGGGQSLSFRVS